MGKRIVAVGCTFIGVFFFSYIALCMILNKVEMLEEKYQEDHMF